MMSTEREIRKRSKMSYGPDKEVMFVFHIRMRKPVNVQLSKVITGGTISARGLIKDAFDTLFFQLIYFVVFHVARHQPIAYLHISVYKPHTNHNSSTRSDEGLTL